MIESVGLSLLSDIGVGHVSCIISTYAVCIKWSVAVVQAVLGAFCMLRYG